MARYEVEEFDRIATIAAEWQSWKNNAEDSPSNTTTQKIYQSLTDDFRQAVKDYSEDCSCNWSKGEECWKCSQDKMNAGGRGT